MARFRESRGLDYDDVLLVPQYSNIESRSKVDISGELTHGIQLNIPVIIANMDTVVNQNVIYEAWHMGALGIMHRYEDPEFIFRDIKELDHNYVKPIIPSIGIGSKQVQLALRYIATNKIHAINIDIAHGHSLNMCETILAIKKEHPYFPLIAGNIATPEAAMMLMNAGADVIKVGIGPGFVCTTRKETGAGYPQLSAIMEIAPVVHEANKHLIADGGIRNCGDIVKALAAGADTVMSGWMFAGSKESGKETYRGMASLEAQKNFKGSAKNIEGKCTNVETKGSIKDILQTIKEGIQSGFSYTGAKDIQTFRSNAEFVIVH